MKIAHSLLSVALGLAVAICPLQTARADRDSRGHFRGGEAGRIEGRHYDGWRGERCYPSYRGFWPWSRPALSFTYVEPAYYYDYDEAPVYYRGGPRDYYRGRSVEVEVQIALAKRGYYHGPIDGDVGPGSRAAIRAYQADRRLRVTGRIDGDLIRALKI